MIGLQVFQWRYFFLTISYKFVHIPDCREQDEWHPHFTSSLKLPYISELADLNYTFKTLFKINPKAIIMGTSSQFHDGKHLKILHTLI